MEVLVTHLFTPRGLVDQSRMSQLSEHCRHGNTQKAQDILQRFGLSVINEFYKTTNDSYYHIHIASEYNQRDIVKLLLDYRVDVNLKNLYENTPLHIASRHGHTALVQFLIENRADMHSRNANGDTPLAAALKYRHIDVAKIFARKMIRLTRPAFFLPYTGMIFRDICRNAYPEIIEFLLDEMKVSLHHFRLHRYVQYSTKQVVQLLIDRGSNVKKSFGVDEFSLLHKVSGEGLNEMVELLLDNGFDVDVLSLSKMTPLHFAAKYGRTETVELLCQRGAAVDASDSNENTALIFAGRYGHAETIETLHRLGANIDAHDLSGNTALLIAAKNNLLPVVKVLCNSGANLSVQDSDGNTALHHCKYEFILKVLLLRGINVEIKNNKGQTASETLCEKMNSLYNECLAEISKIKSVQLSDSLTLYDIFFISSDELSKLVNNAVLDGMFGEAGDSNDYSLVFPNYGYSLYEQYCRGRRKKHNG